MKDFIKKFTLGEKILWLMSSLCITAAFMIFDRGNFLTLIASLFGVTAILLNAKGNPARSNADDIFQRYVRRYFV